MVLMRPATAFAVTALAAAGVLCAATAQAQGIERRAEPYVAPAGPLPISTPVPLPIAAPSDPAAVAPPPADIVMAAARPDEWRIEVADRTLSRSLRRWARQAGTTLLYEASRDLAAVATVYRGSFEQALSAAMLDTQANAQFGLRACAYDNLVRVIARDQKCTR